MIVATQPCRPGVSGRSGPYPYSTKYGGAQLNDMDPYTVEQLGQPLGVDIPIISNVSNTATAVKWIVIGVAALAGAMLLFRISDLLSD